MKKLLSLNIQKFAEFNANITDLIKKFTTDDKFDAEGANKALNENIDKYNSKNQPKVEDFKVKARDEVVAELGIENVTNENQLKAHINGLSSDEQSQDLINITTKYNELIESNKALEGKYTDASGKLVGLENGKFLLGKGVNPDYIDFLSHTIGTKVNEEVDFNKAFEDYSKDNPQYFTPTDVTKKSITTNKAHVVKQTEGVSGVRQALIDKGLIKES